MSRSYLMIWTYIKLGAYASCSLNPMDWKSRVSRPGAALTDEQIGELNECVDKFRAADYEAWEEIVEDFLGSFKSTCSWCIRFDMVIVKTVRAPLVTLGCSHIYLAYLPTPLWRGQTSNEEICSESPKCYRPLSPGQTKTSPTYELTQTWVVCIYCLFCSIQS